MLNVTANLNLLKAIVTKSVLMLFFIYSVKSYFWILLKIYFHMKIKGKINLGLLSDFTFRRSTVKPSITLILRNESFKWFFHLLPGG